MSLILFLFLLFLGFAFILLLHVLLAGTSSLHRRNSRPSTDPQPTPFSPNQIQTHLPKFQFNPESTSTATDCTVCLGRRRKKKGRRRRRKMGRIMAMAMDDDIERILWTESQISQRVSELASEITEDFNQIPHCSSPPVIVGVATGAFLFLADLVRKINLSVSVDFIRAESYGSGTVSNGSPKISLNLKVDIEGKHVILVEDIVDTGNTLSCLIALLKSKGASSISMCILLNKPARRIVNFELVGKGKFYCGFECPDYFMVEYGLDFAELYRNLPYVGILKPQVYK